MLVHFLVLVAWANSLIIIVVINRNFNDKGQVELKNLEEKTNIWRFEIVLAHRTSCQVWKRAVKRSRRKPIGGR